MSSEQLTSNCTKTRQKRIEMMPQGRDVMAGVAKIFVGSDPNLEDAIKKAHQKARVGVTAERLGVKVVSIEFARGGVVDGPEFTARVSRMT